MGELKDLRESMVFSALNSWQSPTKTFSMKNAAMTPASTQDQMAKETASATSKTWGKYQHTDVLIEYREW